MKITVKKFKELSTDELYAILQLRSEVFVVEQDCVYQDIDGKDQKALHVVVEKEGVLVGYTRVFDAGDYFDKPSIGRVVVAKDQRQYGYGYDVMKASIAAVKEVYNETTIIISAQKYLLKFYNNLGFVAEGEEYLEDGIPHFKMVKN